MPELYEGKPFNPYRRFHNAWVPSKLLNAFEITDGARLLYGLLRRYAGKDGNCFPLQATLARDMRRKKSTIRKYVAELRGAGLLQVRPRGKGRSALYEFLWKSSLEPVQMDLSERDDNRALTATNITPEEVPLSGSPNINSSSRACGNVENFGGALESEAIAENQKQEGKSEQPAGTQNGDADGGKLARNGWKVLQLGNQPTRDTDVVAGSLLRKQISELVELKRMKR